MSLFVITNYNELMIFNIVILDLLLRIYSRYPSSEMGESALSTVLFTLEAMRNGGIHDHIGQVSVY